MDYSYFRNGEHLEDLPDQQKPKLNPKWRWVLRVALPLLLAYIFHLLYSGSLDLIVYDKAGEWLVFVLMFIIVPVLIGACWRVWVKREWRMAAYFIGPMSVIINGPILGVWSGRHEEEVFRSRGMKRKAIVTRVFYSKGNRMCYEFDVAGVRHESFNTYNPRPYQEGDTIDIIYDKDNPAMNSPVELVGK